MKDEGGRMKKKLTSLAQRRTSLWKEMYDNEPSSLRWIIKLYVSLPARGVTSVLGTQVLKAGTSVGAHYREAQRAKSNADFISKIEGALQELDETTYWLELLADGNIVKASRLESL